MSDVPKVVDAEARRAELIDAVVERISTAGMDGVTMREVARVAGWTTGAVSHYFSGKRELLLATFEARADLNRRRIEQAAPAGLTPVEALMEASLPVSEEGRANWLVFIAFWSAAIGDTELTEAHQLRHKRFLATVEGALAGEVAAGSMRADLDPDVESRRLVALLNGLAVQAVFDPAGWPPARQREVVAAHLADLRNA